MADRMERAREDARQASDLTEDATVREQLRSIDGGLLEISRSAEEGGSPTDSEEEGGAAQTEGGVSRGDRLQQVEAKPAALGDETTGPVRSLIRDARDCLDD